MALYAVILAGGGGTRLWPVSRQQTPKQVQPLIGEQTLLQATYERLTPDFSIDHVFVSTNRMHADLLRQQLPQLDESQWVLEPIKRDTAPAIGFAALSLVMRDPEAIFVTINSDAHVQHTEKFRSLIQSAGQLVAAEPDRVVLIGVHPTYPETGYGYIKIGKAYPEATVPDAVFTVDRFIEKPDAATAETFVNQWGYLWNPALFVWKAQHVLDLFAQHLPEHYQILMAMKEVWGNQAAIDALFATFPSISIDYGIIEKISNMLVIPGDIGWCDIGQWRTIHQIAATNPEETVTKGLTVTRDTKGSLVYNYTNRMLVATQGLEDMIVVVTDDVVLVCPKDKAQEVKQMVAEIKKQGLDQYL